MQSGSLDIIIPALDAAAHLSATLAALEEGRRSGLVGRVIVSDGGSTDATAALAAAAGAVVLSAPRGRGAQLAVGAEAASAAWLLFLHADTSLEAGWSAVAEAFLAAPENAGRAAAFRLAFDDPAEVAGQVARFANWRARRLGLAYGDQGLLIGRSHYEALGGFRPLPLMEDVDLMRRIGRRRLDLLSAKAVTSAARYRQDGWRRRAARNLALLALYYLGLPPTLLQRLYG